MNIAYKLWISDPLWKLIMYTKNINFGFFKPELGRHSGQYAPPISWKAYSATSLDSGNQLLIGHALLHKESAKHLKADLGCLR